MCILLGILEIARKHYFYLGERKDEKEAAKQAIRKINQVVQYFSTKGRKNQNKIVKQKKTHTWFLKQSGLEGFPSKSLKQILKIVHKLIANEQ